MSQLEARTSVAVVAEKPSVARDIARVLGAGQRGEGYLYGGGYVVTWAIGHLVALAQPHEIQPSWRAWRRDLLPMLPDEWPLVISEQTKDQFEVVRKILTSPKISEIICATDAGREGELIFRYIYEAAECRRPVRRLWISSLTPEAIKDGFASLRDATEYDSLADAARGRSRADWLVGMNLSRAYTLACNEELSVGRVQTPTLAMLVQRELAIRDFVPEDYRNVTATFSPREGQSCEGTWFRPGVEGLEQASRLPADGAEADAIVARVQNGTAVVEKVEAQTKRMAPPPLYDLTELQRHANRLFGLSAQGTLEAAQALYERHKLISYPRTDSRHLSADVAKTLPKVVESIRERYEQLLAPGTGKRPLSRRFVDDSQVTDHHAIIPTGVSPQRADLNDSERRIFDLICRRLLSAWHDDHIWSVTTVITLVTNAQAGSEDRFHSSGTAVQQTGWKVLDLAAPEKKDRRQTQEDTGTEGQSLPPDLAKGQGQQILNVKSVAKRTRPPKRLTDATLLTAMETAGKTLDDRELSNAMKESGLGTPATRAQIIEILLKRGFLERRGKSLEATDKGVRLIATVHPEVKSPVMTGQWESQLKKIERGNAQLTPFMKGIEDYVREVVGKVGTTTPVVPAPVSRRPVAKPELSITETLKQCFGFEQFRPNQEDVCRALIEGNDVLLVMPTGSGKSLCYQLPGVVLGGTTLVISPLIALMEDQVAKLNALGFRAERIHSNRDRRISREVCLQYLDGALDFLFIAPERLRVRGFPEMLARKKPTVVAVDEAHCISQWGHDFRPDYRTLDQHLPNLRPAPVIALTATATRPVQQDIVRQLGLAQPKEFIHGFRRENIAIEVVEVPPNGRFALTKDLLQGPERRPAIVYVPTRRAAVDLAGELERDFPASPYHAGLEGARRQRVQNEFLSGQLQVVVATIAFGMGVDKPDVRTVIHTALPGTVESYYQEIGRAGRDGQPSRAILMHAYVDRHTHDYFFERDYPEVEVLDQVYASLPREPQPREEVKRRCRVPADTAETAVEKLWVHGGAVIDDADNLSRGAASWRDAYSAQRAHKIAQFEKMISWCESSSCRMLSLVRYFGDRTDSQRPCGTCDFCSPQSVIAQQFRAVNTRERSHIEHILHALGQANGTAAGRVYTTAAEAGGLDRRHFETLVVAMARSKLVEVEDCSFEKNGQTIEFRKLWLTEEGRRPGAAVTVQVRDETATLQPGRTRRVKAKKGRRKERRSQAAPDLEHALKTWRLNEARRKGIPAFRVLTDKALHEIAARQPASSAELLEIPGVGQRTLTEFGREILKLVSGQR